MSIRRKSWIIIPISLILIMPNTGRVEAWSVLWRTVSVRRKSRIIISIGLILVIAKGGLASSSIGGWSVRRRKGTESWEHRVVQAIDDSLLRRGDSRAAALLVAGGQ